MTFTVDAGRTVAVVGPTGSGKSTLTTLLVRLVDPASGEVVLDGVDLRAVARGGVAGAAAVVPQQTFLFDDTVRGNVTLGLDVPDSEVRRALRGGAGRPVRRRAARRAGHPDRRARHDAVRRAAAAARAGPGDRPVAAAAGDGRRDVRRSTRGWRRRSSPGCGRTGGADGRSDGGRGRVPQGDDRAGRRGRLRRARPGRRPRARTSSCWAAARATGRSITAYEREDAERAALAADEEAVRAGRLSAVSPSHGPEGLRNDPLHARASPPIALHSLSGPPGRLSRHHRHAGLRPARGCGSALGWVPPVPLCSLAMRAPAGTLLRAGLALALGLAAGLGCTDDPKPGTVGTPTPTASSASASPDPHHPRSADRGSRPRLLRRAHQGRADQRHQQVEDDDHAGLPLFDQSRSSKRGCEGARSTPMPSWTDRFAFGCTTSRKDGASRGPVRRCPPTRSRRRGKVVAASRARKLTTTFHWCRTTRRWIIGNVFDLAG